MQGGSSLCQHWGTGPRAGLGYCGMVIDRQGPDEASEILLPAAQAPEKGMEAGLPGRQGRDGEGLTWGTGHR